MKYLFLLIPVSIFGLYFFSTAEFFEEEEPEKNIKEKLMSNSQTMKYVPDEVPENMSVATKKERFYHLLVPAVQKVHSEWMTRYLSVLDDMENSKNLKKINDLKTKHNVQSDEELLAVLKPHPPSIVLAQAAMESAWATSRFFTEANNIFGMWSVNPDEPRIAAGEARENERIIWLRKFGSIEESVREYYKLMARGHAYEEFREIRLKTDDVFEIIQKLDRYSEIGDKYIQELGSMIKFNKLTKYDIQE
ncbi:glucosaminidase domain-containing protein [bacterium]|nr:glucosaminidase domain-containing protein [bacterium]MBU1990630.1 glucosaminidase domain-containing protein [bacterium]